jgi:glycerophosphoryl diester phosphodiesterase
MIRLPDDFLRLPLTHRAYHDKAAGRTENSPAAFAAAIAAGYGIECDVQLTADRRAAVFHDETLERLTAQAGPVRARTMAELGAIRLRTGGGTIPSLEEMLALVDGRVPLLVEIKDQDGQMGPDVGALEEAVTDALDGYRGPVAVMSFNPHSVALMARLAPGVPRGLTTSAYRPEDWPDLPPEVCDRLREIPDYERTGACFVSHEGRDLARPRVAELKAQGAAILCWTIRSPEQEAQARAVADNVTFEGYAAALRT